MSSFPLTRSRAAALRKQNSLVVSVPNDENSFTINQKSNVNKASQNKQSSSLAKTIPLTDDLLASKRLKISQEELSMNGAPEGDLFDVKVLEPSDIVAYSSSEAAEQALRQACSVDKSSATWAEKFSVVEILRRVVTHHIETLNSSSFVIPAVDSAIDAVISLRSSTVKNGIMCIDVLLGANADDENKCRMIDTLLTRAASGPKFLCEAAGAVVESAIARLSPSVGMKSLSSAISHKNSDVSSRAFVLFASCILRLILASKGHVSTPTASDNDNIDNNTEQYYTSNSTSISTYPTTNNSNDLSECLSRSFTVLWKGLQAKLPAGREASRAALQAIHKHMGEVAFVELLNATASSSTTIISISVTEQEIRDIRREVTLPLKVSVLPSSFTSIPGFYVIVPCVSGGAGINNNPGSSSSTVRLGTNIAAADRRPGLGSNGSSAFRTAAQQQSSTSADSLKGPIRPTTAATQGLSKPSSGLPSRPLLGFPAKSTTNPSTSTSTPIISGSTANNSSTTGGAVAATVGGVKRPSIREQMLLMKKSSATSTSSSSFGVCAGSAVDIVVGASSTTSTRTGASSTGSVFSFAGNVSSSTKTGGAASNTGSGTGSGTGRGFVTVVAVEKTKTDDTMEM